MSFPTVSPPIQSAPKPQNMQGPSVSQGGAVTSGFQTRPMNDPGALAPRGSYNTNAQAVMPDMSDFEPFRQSVFDQFERDIQPQIDQRRARMNQDLVNRGITPGSEAYEREMTRFMQMENDAFSGAQRSALEAALGAQNQFFSQGLGQAQVNAGLQQARWANDASRFNTITSADTQRYGIDQGREGSLERLLMSLGEQGRQFDASLGQRGYEFDAGRGDRRYEFDTGFGFQQGQADFSNLMNLLGFGAGAVGQNNAANNQQLGSLASILGGFMPNAPFVPNDVTGAFGLANQANMANAQTRQQQQAGTWGAIGQIGAAALPFFSDRNMKHSIEAVDNDETLERLRKVPVSRWKYNGDDREHIGPMAQDFGSAVSGNPDARVIYPVDAFGSMLAAIQALADKVDALTERMEAASV